MLFVYGRRRLSCYFSSSVSTPQQAYNLHPLRPLQQRQFLRCILCITNYFNVDDFDPDAFIATSLSNNSSVDAEQWLQRQIEMLEFVLAVANEKENVDHEASTTSSSTTTSVGARTNTAYASTSTRRGRTELELQKISLVLSSTKFQRATFIKVSTVKMSGSGRF